MVVWYAQYSSSLCLAPPRRASLVSYQLREGPQLPRHVGTHQAEHHFSHPLCFHRGEALAQLLCRPRERELFRRRHVDAGRVVLVQLDAVAISARPKVFWYNISLYNSQTI